MVSIFYITHLVLRGDFLRSPLSRSRGNIIFFYVSVYSIVSIQSYIHMILLSSDVHQINDFINLFITHLHTFLCICCRAFIITSIPLCVSLHSNTMFPTCCKYIYFVSLYLLESSIRHPTRTPPPLHPS